MRLGFSNMGSTMFWILRGALASSSSMITTGLPVVSFNASLVKNRMTPASLSGNGIAVSPSALAVMSKYTYSYSLPRYSGSIFRMLDLPIPLGPRSRMLFVVPTAAMNCAASLRETREPKLIEVMLCLLSRIYRTRVRYLVA